MWSSIPWLKVARRSDSVVLAEYITLRRRIPFLYTISIINTALLSFSFHGYVPWPMTTILPLVVLGGLALRTYHWLTAPFPNAAQRRRLVEIAPWVALVLTLAMLAVTLPLFYTPVPVRPGHLTSHGHTILYLAITMTTVVILLNNLPRVALPVLFTGTPAAVLALISKSDRIELIVAVNMLLLGVAMSIIVLVTGRDFVRFVETRGAARREAQRNFHIARTDFGSDLPNRRRFFEWLAEKDRQQGAYAVAQFDIDGFQTVNRAYGRAEGDRILAQIGQRIRALEPAFGTGLQVARLGNDEFGVIVHDPLAIDLESCLRGFVADALGASDPDRPSILLTASIGLAFGDGQMGSDEVMARAGHALDRAKRSGGGGLETFGEADAEAMQFDTRIEQALAVADFENDIVIALQPIYYARSGKLSGFEVLCRWDCAGLGAVSPARFIPIAERGPAIERITLSVLRQALDAARTLPESMRIKLNLSIRDLVSPVQQASIAAMVAESGVKPSRLTFEVTETLLAREFDMVKQGVAALRRMGARIAIDDFGSGYSGLSYVLELKPDAIKLDRLFAAGFANDEWTAAAARSIIRLCADVGTMCISEGIETREQAETMTRLGCHELQGFYLGKPMPVPGALALAAVDDPIVLDTGITAVIK